MSRLRLTLACWDYDRTRALADGRVSPEGIDLNMICLEVEETFFRMLRNAEFDIAEMSLSSYCVSLFQENPRFVALPIFPSRFFRHSCVFVSAKSGIREPRDLVGRRVGVPEYQMTAPVWIRGVLQDEYGVDPASVTYFTGGEEEPGRTEKLGLRLPEKFQVVPIGEGKILSRMLAAGEIDALHTARTPSTFYSQPDAVRRLFPDYVPVEKTYFRKTGIFPIMHVVVMRRSLYEAHRWIARSLFKAFVASQRIAYDNLAATSAMTAMLPWQVAAVEEARLELGSDWWPYGLEKNRKVLSTFLRYHHEQGLSPRLLTADEIFAEEIRQSFKI